MEESVESRALWPERRALFSREGRGAVRARWMRPSSVLGQNGHHRGKHTWALLKRQVSPEELQTPGGPYIKKTFTIVGDAVGWGFVVRGNKPCHIQAVDPSGPAAAAGMKVCQFVVSVNGLNVLSLDYKTVSNLILTGPRTIVMEVMEEIDY
ncbi:hypothetical protein Z043_101800 [Scleropages formosus]|uniref:PDZ domain-containing protein n=1 Tax=Scleropages formosus TaxID=113540 RepID=A0A0P7ZCK4_SCLFO|nr:hypothetical protein Z043_101800 [Scleropages formosus]